MKSLIIAVGAIVVMISVWNLLDIQRTSYVAEPQVIEKEVHPEWAKDEDAIKAAQDVIKKKELEAELLEVQGNIDTLVTRRTELQKELGSY